MSSKLWSVAAVALVAALHIGAASAQTFEKKNIAESAGGKGKFSDAVVITGPAKMIYLAGTADLDPATGNKTAHPNDFMAQCKGTWANIEKALKAQGAGLEDIVKATTYITDLRNHQGMRNCRREVFAGKVFPPHTFLNISHLAEPDMLIEIEVVAAVAAK